MANNPLQFMENANLTSNCWYTTIPDVWFRWELECFQNPVVWSFFKILFKKHKQKHKEMVYLGHTLHLEVFLDLVSDFN